MKISFQIILSLLFIPSFCFSESNTRFIATHISDTAACYKISASLPAFDSQEYPALNVRVKKFSDSVQQDFADECKNFGQTKDTAAQSRLNLTTENLWVSKSMISFCFRISIWHFHAAHPYDILRTVNYEIKENRILSAREMLAAPERRVKDLLIQKLQTDRESCFDPVELHRESPDRFQISLERDSVVFNFSQAEIGAYVCGEKRIRLSKKGLVKQSL